MNVSELRKEYNTLLEFRFMKEREVREAEEVVEKERGSVQSTYFKFTLVDDKQTVRNKKSLQHRLDQSRKIGKELRRIDEQIYNLVINEYNNKSNIGYSDRSTVGHDGIFPALARGYTTQSARRQSSAV